MGEVNMVLAGTLIMAIGLAFIPVPRVYSGQFIAIAILTLGNGLSTPVLSSLVSQLSPEAERGEILGVFQSLQSLGRICGPLIGSALFNFASYSTPFIVGGLIMLSSFLLALKLRKANISPAQNYGGLAQGEDTSSGGSPLAEAQ
jgi:DHA1 family tetracycline resistance protein-like MFS transporter